jgi:hypothetical protein
MLALAITSRNFWTWFGGIWLGIGVPFLAIGIGVAIDGARLGARLAQEGRTVSGTVLAKEIREQDFEPVCRVDYRFFPPEGAPITGSAEIAEAAWDTLVERGPIAITYLPGDPRRHRVRGQGSSVLLPAIFGVLGSILTFLGGMVLVKSRAARRVAEPLGEDGSIAEATVVDLRTARLRIHGVWQWRVRYRFTDGAGRTHEGAATIAPEEADGLEAGSRGRVRYDPDRPRRSIWLRRDGA